MIQHTTQSKNTSVHPSHPNQNTLITPVHVTVLFAMQKSQTYCRGYEQEKKRSSASSHSLKDEYMTMWKSLVIPKVHENIEPLLVELNETYGKGSTDWIDQIELVFSPPSTGGTKDIITTMTDINGVQTFVEYVPFEWNQQLVSIVMYIFFIPFITAQHIDDNDDTRTNVSLNTMHNTSMLQAGLHNVRLWDLACQYLNSFLHQVCIRKIDQIKDHDAQKVSFFQKYSFVSGDGCGESYIRTFFFQSSKVLFDLINKNNRGNIRFPQWFRTIFSLSKTSTNHGSTLEWDIVDKGDPLTWILSKSQSKTWRQQKHGIVNKIYECQGPDKTVVDRFQLLTDFIVSQFYNDAKQQPQYGKKRKGVADQRISSKKLTFCTDTTDESDDEHHTYHHDIQQPRPQPCFSSPDSQPQNVLHALNELLKSTISSTSLSLSTDEHKIRLNQQLYFAYINALMIHLPEELFGPNAKDWLQHFSDKSKLFTYLHDHHSRTVLASVVRESSDIFRVPLSPPSPINRTTKK